VKNKLLLLLVILLVAGAGVWGGRLSVKREEKEETPKAKIVAFSAQKQEKPNVKFFVMSFCPYGNQAEEGLKPVAEALGSEGVEWEPHYIVSKLPLEQAKRSCEQQVYSAARCEEYVKQGYFPDAASCKKRLFSSLNQCLAAKGLAKGKDFYTSLHGAGELRQDVREICAWQQVEDKRQWWDFVSRVNSNCNAQNVDECWSEQASAANLDVSRIEDCLQKEAVSLLEAEIAMVEKYDVRGSPTFIFNETPYPPRGAYPASKDEVVKMKIGDEEFSPGQYRSPEAFKEAICAGWKNPGRECKKELSEASTGASGGCR